MPLVCYCAESGRYFWTARAFNLGHVENCLLLISFRSVCLGRLNEVWWRYLMSAALYVIAYALYAMCLVWTVCVSGDVLLDSCGGNTHNLVCGSRVDKHRKPLCYHRGDSIEVFHAYQHLVLPSILVLYYNTHYICPHHIVPYIQSHIGR